MRILIIENGVVTLLLWKEDIQINEVKILINPDINEMFIDEDFLKKSLESIPQLNCLENASFEIAIKLTIPEKVSSHSFYCSIMPVDDFPQNLRNKGVSLILGHQWIEMTQYQI